MLDGFSSIGAVEHNTWYREGKTIVCEGKGLSPDGKEVKIKYLHDFDGDFLIFKLTEMVVDGEKQPDEVFKYRRIR